MRRPSPSMTAIPRHLTRHRGCISALLSRSHTTLTPSLSLIHTHTTHTYTHTYTHTHILENIHKHAFLKIPKKSAYEQCNTLPIVVYKAYLQLRTYIYNYITYIHTLTLNLYIIFIIYSLTITCTHPNCPE